MTAQYPHPPHPTDPPPTPSQSLKTIGFWNYHYCNSGAEGWALYLLTQVLGWPLEACQVYIAKFRAALLDRRNHAY